MFCHGLVTRVFSGEVTVIDKIDLRREYYKKINENSARSIFLLPREGLKRCRRTESKKLLDFVFRNVSIKRQNFTRIAGYVFHCF